MHLNKCLDLYIPLEKFFHFLSFSSFYLTVQTCPLISLYICYAGLFDPSLSCAPHFHTYVSSSIECSILSMRSLLRILRYHTVYRDVFREVGVLEVMVTCLHRYANQLKEQNNTTG